jgi:2-polyprenyl-3-methyl-5-hydroxy-6-metoxy-1,4-benzoquinol methylase
LATVSARYEASLAEPLYPLETAYALLGPIRGRRVLDVGCGHGEHSLLFAHWGAVVTGVDISEGAVAVCRRRAQSLGLSEATTFVNSPFEALTQTEQRFDIVWTCAFLHHVLDRLESVIQLFDRLLLPGGTILFMEPVRLSPWVKTARRLVPLPAAGTPDERPLERGDLATIDNVLWPDIRWTVGRSTPA